MKYSALYFIILSFFCLPAFTQAVQYSKETIALRDDDDISIVGSFKDTIHVIKENVWGKKELLLYNSNMHLLQRKTLQDDKEGYAETEIISYGQFYYLIIRDHRARKFKVLKVNASGMWQDKTTELKEQFPTNSFEPFLNGQFQKVRDQIMFTILFYDFAHEKLFFTTSCLDSSLVNKNKHLVTLNFKADQTVINRIVFPDTSDMYIVESFKVSSPQFGEVRIIRHNFHTDSSREIALSGRSEFFLDPHFSYTERDSSFLFFAKTTERTPLQSDTANFRFFYLRMNRGLEETSPSMPVQVIPGKKERVVILTPYTMPGIFVSGEFLQSMYSGTESFSTFSVDPYMEGSFREVFNLNNPSSFRVNSRSIAASRVNPNRKRIDINMRILWIDPATGRKTDVLLSSKNKKLKAEFFNCAAFGMEGKFILFYTNSFSISRGGVSYISVANGSFGEEQQLIVHPKYDYILTLAKQINQQYFIVPYIHKSRLGLMKISLSR